jgi:hypothetical protein
MRHRRATFSQLPANTTATFGKCPWLPHSQHAMKQGWAYRAALDRIEEDSVQMRREIGRYPDWFRTLATCIAVTFGIVEAVDWPARYAMAQTLPAAPPAVQPAAPDAKLDQPQLEQLLAPVALYPDNLLALVLMASTYPLEIVQAQRWLAKPGNDKLKDVGLEQALASQSWDPSVKSLVGFPLALKMMADQLEWTQRLGDTVLAQQQDVLNAVQVLRARAQKAGTLESGPQQTVNVTSNISIGATSAPAAGAGGGAPPVSPAVTPGASYVVPPPAEIITIEPTQPDQVYVPAYNPNVAYGSWPYPSYPPPYYPPPPYYGYGTALLTGIAFAGGAALIGAACCWANTGWNSGNIVVNNNRVANIDRTGVANGNWQHRTEHRQGVGYRDQEVRNRYQGNRSDRNASREQFRGRVGNQGEQRDRAGAGSGRSAGSNLGGGANRPGGGSSGVAANRPGSANRPGGGNVGASGRPGAAGGNRAAQRPANTSAGRSGGVSQARNGRPNVSSGAGGRQQFAAGGGGFGGVGQGPQVRAAGDRGQASRQSPASTSFGGRGGGSGGQRATSRGGGGRAPGGGGGSRGGGGGGRRGR